MEVIQLIRYVGCVRNKLKFRTVQQNSKSSLWTLDWDLDGIHALDLWDLILLVFGNTIQNHDRTVQPVVNCDKSHGPNKRSHVLKNVDLFPQTSNFRIKKLCCVCWRTTKQLSRWSLKGRSPSMRHVSRTHRSCSWLVVRSNQFGPQFPNQVHRDQKPTCRHANQGKCHTWRMESPFVFVQHQPFQLYRVFWSDVEKNAKRFMRRESHSEVEANDEPCCKGSLNSLSSSASESLVKEGHESQSPWSSKAEKNNRMERPVVDRGVYSARHSRWDDDKAFLFKSGKLTNRWMIELEGHETQSSFFHEKTQHVIVDEERTSWYNGPKRCVPSKRNKATAIHHWKRRNRIRIVNGIQIILEKGKWSSAEKTKTIFDDVTENDEKILWYGEC